MSVFEHIERRVWSMASGSSHPNYRQAIWRPSSRQPDEIALSNEFSGDLGASRWNRRSWSQVGVIAVRDAEFAQLQHKYPDARPAVAFASADRVFTGRLQSFDDIGKADAGDSAEFRVHGMRLGRGRVQFGLGVLTTANVFVSADTLVTMGQIDVAFVGDPGVGFKNMNFS